MKKGLLIFCLLFSIVGFAQSKKIIPVSKRTIDSLGKIAPPPYIMKQELPKNHIIVTDTLRNKVDTILVLLEHDMIDIKKSKKK
jgi:hypothetical protein